MTDAAVDASARKNRYVKRCGERLCFVCGEVLVYQRSTRKYCNNGGACRQSAYRRRQNPRVSHRRAARSRIAPVVREAVSLAQAVVRPIPLREARQVIQRREPMCGVATLAFGLFLGSSNLPASVAVFGVHPASNLSPRHDQTIALLRGHTEDWAPKNCATKLIRRAMDQLPARYMSVIAFSDATVGENGTIYRAASFQPVGASRGGRRVLVHHEGKVISERTARRRFGTASAVAIAKLGCKVETAPRRSRWIATRFDQAPQRGRP